MADSSARDALPNTPSRWPLTRAQTGIWLGQQLDPRGSRYNAAECIALDGPIDRSALEAAISRAVAECETLRMRIFSLAGAPVQQLSAAAFHPAIVALDPDATLEDALRWMRSDLTQPLSLTSGMLYRGAILTTRQHTYWYHAAHHIALDGYGFAMVARRVAALYNRLIGGQSCPEQGFGGMAEVVEEDARYAGSQAQVADRAYWTSELAGRPPVVSFSEHVALPADSALREHAEVAASLQRQLADLAKPVRATWADACIATLALQLQRATDVDDITLGLPVMGRIGSVTLRVPCMTMNIVPLRVRLQQDDDLASVTGRVAASLRAQRPHSRYRYEQLRRDLGLVGGDRRLFGPVINLMPFDLALTFGGVRARVHNVSAGPVEDLSIGIVPRGEGQAFRVDFDANPGCYTPSRLRTLAHDYVALLEESGRATGPARPQPRGASVTWGPALERPATDVLAAFLEQARSQPDAIALEQGELRVSYRELELRARALAAHLQQRGVAQEDLVALHLTRSPDAIAAMLAVWLRGAAYLPLDVDGPPERTRAMLAEAAPKLALSTSAHADRLPQALPALCVDRLPTEAVGSDTPPPLSAALAYVIYTSGSTGHPNGVAIERGALAHFVAAARQRYELTASDRVLQFAPLHFDACVEEIFVTLCVGATLVLRTDSLLASLPGWMRACEALGISVLDLPTALWHELVYAMSAGITRLPACVRLVIIGGEAALPERVQRFCSLAPAGTRLINTYGPTEATVVATSAVLSGAGALETRERAPIGHPLPGVGTCVVDARGRAAVGPARGELYLLGPSLARGYLGSPTRQAERFVTLQQLPGSPRAYRTGDLVERRGDGALEFVGRVDDEVKISGQRVDPAEVERVLLQHPQVRQACVVVCEAEGTKHLIAHIEADSPLPGEARLREHAQRHLLAAAVPREFVFADALPKTTSGKLDRRALQRHSQAAQPQLDATNNELEPLVLSVFARVLGRAALGPEQDFFECGGQSLQTIQVANALSSALHREIEVAVVFRNPTARALARALVAHAREPDTVTETQPAPLPAAALSDARLPAELHGQLDRARPEGFEHVLLTGASGFVGAQLLHALLSRTRAHVVCLIRASDPASAWQRLHTALARQGLAVPQLAERVSVECAELSLPQLGLTSARYAALAERCDSIVHAAASVSLNRSYDSLRAANVIATRELIQLACRARAKALHHVSTLAVAPGLSIAPEVPERFFAAHGGLRDGYTQSKWAAEELMRQVIDRGVHAQVYRLGRVVGSVTSGYVNPSDIVWRIIRAGLLCGALPELDVSEPWTPVDYVASAVVELAQSPTPKSAVYHVVNEPQLQLRDVFSAVQAVRGGVELVPLPSWLERMANATDADSIATRSFFELRRHEAAARAGLGRIHNEHTSRALAHTNLTPPVIDQAAIARYLAFSSLLS